MKCGDIPDIILCAFTNKTAYFNLVISFNSISSSYYCVWDTYAAVCIEKNSNKGNWNAESFS
jgi:hypothetical protein